MAPNFRRRQLVWLAPVALAVVAFMVLDGASGWNPRYTLRVIMHGDSSPADATWRPQTGVQASTKPMPWPTADGCATLGPLPTAGADSLVIIRGGRLICDWYGKDSGPDQAHAAFSISKTVVSLLASKEIAEARLPGLDTKLTSAVTELRAKDARFDAVTLEDLLDMRSGIGFSEEINFPWINADYPSVYYSTDLAGLITTRPEIVTAPGSFQYNDYGPNLVGLAAERITGQKLTGAPFQRLWDELGAEHPATWAVDDQGFPHYESGLSTTARDLARIGQLVLDHGRAGDRQVAPPAFLHRSLEPTATDPAVTYGNTALGYRNGWWRFPAADGALDLVAMGAHGQLMLVSPTTDTVIVRFGNSPTNDNIALARELQSLARIR